MDQDKEKLYTLRWNINKAMNEGDEKNEALKIISELLGESIPKPLPGRETPDLDHKGSMKVAIIVGHEKSAPGADFALQKKYPHEYAYNTAIAHSCESFVDSGAYSAIQLKVIFRDGIGIGGAYEVVKRLGVDVAIELHFNAYNGVAKGSETLCSVDQKDKDLAAIIHEGICSVFERGGPSRGVKVLSRSDRGGQSVYSAQCANCLVEPFFGDNPDEAKLAVEKFDAYAKSLLDSCVKWGIKQGLLS